MTASDHASELFKYHLHERGHPYMHKSADGRTSPFPGQTYPATSVMGVPSAVNPFRTATRTWNSAT